MPDRPSSDLRWWCVTRRVTTEETVYVQAPRRSAAIEKVREGDYDGAYNPRHVRETIRDVYEAPAGFDPETLQ